LVLLQGFIKIAYDDLEAWAALNQAKHCRFFGRATREKQVLYLAKVICESQSFVLRVLFIADEVQTGIARTGRLLTTMVIARVLTCENKPEAKPDILIWEKQSLECLSCQPF
jgi:ornithine--oxo-acid transaminase